MNDMSSTIIAKSDQINAADIVGAPITITINEVRIKAGEEQPCSIYFDGDKKAFRPCKGVRRLLVKAWGLDANNYIGKSLTLFYDKDVMWAGKPEGGIRVSHMSDIDSEFIESMRINRAQTKPYKISPLAVGAPANKRQTAAEWAEEQICAAKVCANWASLSSVVARGAKPMEKLEKQNPELWADVNAAYAEARAALDTDAGDGFADEGGE